MMKRRGATGEGDVLTLIHLYSPHQRSQCHRAQLEITVIATTHTKTHTRPRCTLEITQSVTLAIPDAISRDHEMSGWPPQQNHEVQKGLRCSWSSKMCQCSWCEEGAPLKR